MKLVIDFLDETNEVSEAAIMLVDSVLQFAAETESIEEGSELSVSFVDNARIQEINKQFREKDAATDVISFAMEEMGEDELAIVGADMPRILGDIIISIERTKEQAAEYGHSFDRELGFLALHGFLHLLGYDHMTEEDETVMFTKQKDILAAYGLSR
ncbi:rRNA maturation RNase YbeY [Peribacillus psychrosaccharolyticus]|uniref:Endoribonuclease YbeY n=1 Tax=Peribacillus psychrosaccharolyticus TaxID=1407 RepID=A0A974NL47_PERPY|nr:rRNA maturation RNase YbeY [Peribacillus psychrosaccharolyticus]MEC2054327.1 rRNA maturation RNase YbeY [Peribacillus psychrosaccharolyticus]MED3744445.1 rRNA maturation RNase YbeY [Peribacillus psychrosaccharolyticus]QQS99915.1 rRNA maturation RNase YbeY [Peribacillus psychrosaccharolyticus]